MQMGTGGQTSRADISDRLTLHHAGSAPDAAGKAAQVSIAGGDPVHMAQLDEIAVPSGPFRPQDHSIAGRHDRGAGCGRIVGAFVSPAQAEHRVITTAGKIGGDPPELYWRPEERPPK